MKRALLAIVVAVLFASGGAAQAPDPLLEARALIDSGRIAEARTRLAELLAQYRKEGNAEREGITLMLLGVAEEKVDEIAPARKHLREAVQTFRAQNDDLDVWLVLSGMAMLELRAGNQRTSMSLHEEALAALHNVQRPESRVSIEALKVVGPQSGVPIELLAAMPGMIKPILAMMEPVSRDAYAAVLMEAGELDKADEQLRLAASGSFAGMFDRLIAVRIGDLRRRQSRFDEARASYLKALNGNALMDAMPVPTGPDKVTIFARLADLEALGGRLDEGLQWNEKALQIVRDARDSKREADLLEHRGTLLMQAARFTDAEKAFTQAFTVAQRTHDDSIEASVEASLGALYMFRGSYGSAAAHLERSIALYQKVNQVYLETAVWTNLATVYLLLGADEDVSRMLDTVRELAKKSESPLAARTADMMQCILDLFAGRASAAEVSAVINRWAEAFGPGLDSRIQEALLSLVAFRSDTPTAPQSADAAPGFMDTFTYILEARVLLQRGDFAGAREASMKGFKLDPTGELAAGYCGLIGATYAREGRADEAIHWFTKAANALETQMRDLRVEEMLSTYLGRERQVYFDVLIHMLLGRGRVEEAFDYAERARARGFLQLVGNTRLKPTAGGEAALVRETEALRTRLPSLHGQELELARGRYEALLPRVKSTNPEYAALTNVTPVSLQAVQSALPANTTMISYFVSSFGTHAWVLDRARAQHVALPADTAALQRIVCWANELRATGDVRYARGPVPDDPGCGGTPATAEEAFDALIAPLIGEVRNTRLIIVPHGPLHYVPFAALRDRRTQRYLVQDYTISYAPSASALDLMREKESPVKWSALVLGDPKTADSALQRLHGAQREALQVAAEFGSTPKLGADAAESLLYELHGGVGVVHIAAHGSYDSKNPLFSRIALAPGGGKNGDLEVHEILSDLDLTGVNLVVLSACSSGLGQRSGGDEVVGLTRALLYAGTPGVIATLWEIDDDAAADLMDAFYCRLLAGASAAEALRAAQLALLQSARYSNPQFWAAFTLTGDPQARWNR